LATIRSQSAPGAQIAGSVDTGNDLLPIEALGHGITLLLGKLCTGRFGQHRRERVRDNVESSEFKPTETTATRDDALPPICRFHNFFWEC
jgi:hypothetical protein